MSHALLCAQNNNSTFSCWCLLLPGCVFHFLSGKKVAVDGFTVMRAHEIEISAFLLPFMHLVSHNWLEYLTCAGEIAVVAHQMAPDSTSVVLYTGLGTLCSDLCFRLGIAP